MAATFRTVERPRAECEAMLREITRWRRDHQPGGTFNAGSVFKNPEGDSAGRIIDDLGLKGLRIGGVAVSERHANFFVADPGTAAQDIYDLVDLVRDRVARAPPASCWSPRCGSSATSGRLHDRPADGCHDPASV